jgi:hypothetical protein
VAVAVVASRVLHQARCGLLEAMQFQRAHQEEGADQQHQAQASGLPGM